MTRLFADTYALVEILKGNPAYEDISQEELITSEFRISTNKNGKKLSLIDSVGYACSKRLNIRFLTGDLEFKGIENVAYIK